MSSETINQFILESSALVFRTMIADEIASTTVSVEDLESCVVASIGVAGEGGGTLFLRCSLDTAVELAAMLLGVSSSEIDPEGDMRDAIGEIANMIAGNLKTKLAPTLPNLVLSIPKVIIGESTKKADHPANGQRVNVAILVKTSPVLVQFVFSQN